MIYNEIFFFTPVKFDLSIPVAIRSLIGHAFETQTRIFFQLLSL